MHVENTQLAVSNERLSETDVADGYTGYLFARGLCLEVLILKYDQLLIGLTSNLSGGID